MGWLGTASAFYANAAELRGHDHRAVHAAAARRRARRGGSPAPDRHARRLELRPRRCAHAHDAPAARLGHGLHLAVFHDHDAALLAARAANSGGQHGILMGSSGLGAFAGSLWLLRIAAPHRTAYLRGSVVAIVVCMLGACRWRAIWPKPSSRWSLLTSAPPPLRPGQYHRAGTRAGCHPRPGLGARGAELFRRAAFLGAAHDEVRRLVGLRLAMGAAALLFGGAATLLSTGTIAPAPGSRRRRSRRLRRRGSGD